MMSESQPTTTTNCTHCFKEVAINDLASNGHGGKLLYCKKCRSRQTGASIKARHKRNGPMSRDQILEAIRVKRAYIDDLISTQTTTSEGGCREWVGRKDKDGYGKLFLYHGGKRVELFVHRIALASADPDFDITDRSVVALHSCDNPPCISTEHLSRGTQLENIRDCVAKGRKFVSGKSCIA